MRELIPTLEKLPLISIILGTQDALGSDLSEKLKAITSKNASPPVVHSLQQLAFEVLLRANFFDIPPAPEASSSSSESSEASSSSSRPSRKRDKHPTDSQEGQKEARSSQSSRSTKREKHPTEPQNDSDKRTRR
jgi:hypothetical protein